MHFDESNCFKNMLMNEKVYNQTGLHYFISLIALNETFQSLCVLNMLNVTGYFIYLIKTNQLAQVAD